MSSSVLTLYQIEDHLAALIYTVDLVEPEQEQEFALEFQTALKSAIDKRDRVGHFLAHLESQISLADAEMKRLRSRKESLTSVAERIERYVQQTIESLGMDEDGRYRKLEGQTTCFSLRACPPSVSITNEDAVPADYKVFTIKFPAELWEEITAKLDGHLLNQIQQHVALAQVSIDKRAVKADIDAGRTIPGADLSIGNYALRRT